MHAGLSGGPTISLKGAREGRPQPASARPEAFSALRSSPPAPFAACSETSGASRPGPLRRNAAHVLQHGPRRSCVPALEHGATAASCGEYPFHKHSPFASECDAVPLKMQSKCPPPRNHTFNSSRVDARSGDIVTAQLTLLRAFDRRSVSTIDVGSIQNIACASSSKNTTACVARLRLGLPGHLGAIEPALQGGARYLAAAAGASTGAVKWTIRMSLADPADAFAQRARHGYSPPSDVAIVVVSYLSDSRRHRAKAPRWNCLHLQGHRISKMF